MPVVLSNNGNGRKKTVKGTGIRPAKAAETQYFDSMSSILKLLKDRTGLLSRIIVEGTRVQEVIDGIQSQIDYFTNLFEVAAEELVPVWSETVGQANKKRIEDMLKRTLGIDVARIIDDPSIKDAFDLSINENVQLIKSIPTEHYQKVSQAIIDNYRGIKFTEGSLTNRLRKIGSITTDRAEMIARDQTAKLTSDLNRIRQENAGISHYIWRTSKDTRVVGNPAGKYPRGNKTHMNHWEREGKIFAWDDPPPDGHPGQPINCRCYPQPIIDRSKLNGIRI